MRTILVPVVACFAFCAIAELSLGQSASQQAKAGIKFNGLELSSDGQKWMVAAVQITPKAHPNGKAALNKKYIDDVKMDVYLCFKNKSKENKIFRETKRKAELREVLDYYHAEVKIPTMEVSPKAKSFFFLLPLAIAKRDGYEKVREPYGQVVDISIGGISIQNELQENAKSHSAKPIIFGRYREASVLQSFKQQAIANSASNEGIFVPGQLIFPALTQAQKKELMDRLAGFPKMCGVKSALAEYKGAILVPKIH